MNLVTYCTDTAALVAELKSDHPNLVAFDDDRKIDVITWQTNGIRYNGTKTLTIMYADDKLAALVGGLTSLKVLNGVEDGGDYLAGMTTANRALYDSVHDQTPYVDDEGNTVTPDPYIGGFA